MAYIYNIYIHIIYIIYIYLIIQAACLENSLTKDEAQEPEKPPEEAVFVHPEMLGFCFIFI